MKSCKHPKKPENLIAGKCGTCAMVKTWEDLANDTKDPRIAEPARKIADMFRRGDMIFDRKRGKTLLDFEKEFNLKKKNESKSKNRK